MLAVFVMWADGNSAKQTSAAMETGGGEGGVKELCRSGL